MPKYSYHVRTQIKLLHHQGLHPAGILKTLKGKGLVVSPSGISRIIKKLHLTGSVANLPHSGRPRKLPVEARAFIDQQMRKNDEMTSATIQKRLAKRGISVSSQKQQGWTLQWTTFCQLIRDANAEGWHLIWTPNLIHKLCRDQQFYSAKNAMFKLIHSSRLKLIFDSAHVKCDV